MTLKLASKVNPAAKSNALLDIAYHHWYAALLPTVFWLTNPPATVALGAIPLSTSVNPWAGGRVPRLGSYFNRFCADRVRQNKARLVARVVMMSCFFTV